MKLLQIMRPRHWAKNVFVFAALIFGQKITDPIAADEVRQLLSTAPGVSVLDDRANNRFPMPIDATDNDDILVGRIRQDESVPENRGINIWVAGDQLRKGAALNAVQIAEKLL